MKNLWKNLCACSMALACGVGLAGCGKDDTLVSKDLDGDGAISSWETVFDASSNSSSTSVTGELSYIRSASDLLSINDNTDVRKIYILSRDIDLGGKEVCINLGTSDLYGNGHIISNFKLGTFDVNSLYVTEGDEESLAEEESTSTTSVKCLFYGGSGIYNVRLFMGLQSVNLDAGYSVNDYYISPFVNSSYLDHISVKGKLDITAQSIDGRNGATLNASLIHSHLTTKDYDAEGFEIDVEHAVNIRNCQVDGNIKTYEEEGSLVIANIGSIASNLTKNSRIYNAYAKVDMNIHSAYELNLGGLVGTSAGFISTSVSTGEMNVSGTENANCQYVGGILGVNSQLAELKNSSTNVTINYDSVEAVHFYNDVCYGGMVGFNKGGIIECAQSDATLNISTIQKVYVGGLCGYSENGIISYAICRGGINVTNASNLYIAQVSGFTKKGLLEKIITTTNLIVDTSNIDATVNAGMVTIFENVTSIGDSYLAFLDSPYFKNILVDGLTEISMREGNTFRYELGLRNLFRNVSSTEEGEEGETVTTYETKLPNIYSNLYYVGSSDAELSAGCRLVKYNVSNGQKNEASPSVSYAVNTSSGSQSAVQSSGREAQWIIDHLDFKNYLNHNEVNIGSDIAFSELYFTLDESQHEVSYFGKGSYNQELAYFDKEFTQSYIHDDSSLGSCAYDSKDEFMSYIYSLITSTKTSLSDAIKISKDFLEVEVLDEGEEDVVLSSISANVRNFATIISNSCTCLNLSEGITYLNVNKENVEESMSEDIVKYIQLTFEDSSTYYTILFDISGLEDAEVENYIVYITYNSVVKTVS